MIDPDELAAWLRLTRTPEVGRESARRLLAAFGSPERVFESDTSAWREVIGAKAAGALARRPAGASELVDTTLAWLGASPERHSITVLGDPAYPQALFETADPPLLLYGAGDITLLQKPSIAIVGSRHPTPQGLQNARQFAEGLAAAGYVITSGLAVGIDGAAHEGALANMPEGSAGTTIAVVGTGLDRMYPPRHRDLAHRIVDQGGLLLSEFPLGTPPLPGHFPMRNRIIAGLSRATLVVEAALRSGSLITARMALECGRDVFAIPGSIHSLQSRGCHALIRQGALLVESVQDILDDLQPVAGATMTRPGQLSSPSLTATGAGEFTMGDDAAPVGSSDPLLTALGHDPVSLDALVARTGDSAALLNVRLLEFELMGFVARLPGQLFQRIGSA